MMQSLLNLLRPEAPSSLQTRIVALFSLGTIVPTLLVALFSALLFNLGVQAWFNERVTTAVEESQAVAEAYLDEHKENIRADALAMAADLGRSIDLAAANPAEFERIVRTQAVIRSLTEVMVFRGNKIIAQGRLSFALSFERLPQNVLDRANTGEVVIMTDDPDKVRALVKMQGMEETYLIVGRLVDAKVVAHLENTRGAVSRYQKMRERLWVTQLGYSFAFLLVALVLLAAAIAYGVRFAKRLSDPVAQLAAAAERVRGGDFSAKVEVSSRSEELSTLARAFNRMTEQLDAQRKDLMEANRQLDERRRFSEAVLAGVSAGVVALNAQHRVTLLNRTAAALLEREDQEPLVGKELTSVLHGLDALLEEAEHKGGEVAQATLTLMREARQLSLHVRVTAERQAEHIEGFIVTFDDITLLVTAQRSAAWADVARRVAHEIKNPLTPITLAAERLKRKYLKLIEPAEEAESFSKYIDTIARHVGDIGRMVEEFVSFARMPAPVFARHDLVAIIRKASFSEQSEPSHIGWEFDLPDMPAYTRCDEGQMGQVFGNLFKNAIESIEMRMNHEREVGREPKPGRIRVALKAESDGWQVMVHDNGTGFPPGQIQKMLEPYTTTRTRGSGLGLSIVKKIMEDHKAKLILENHPEGGACVLLTFAADSDIVATA